LLMVLKSERQEAFIRLGRLDKKDEWCWRLLESYSALTVKVFRCLYTHTALGPTIPCTNNKVPYELIVWTKKNIRIVVSTLKAPRMR
jgi:hypothetical protein